VAYVLDADGRFRQRCNLEMVDLEPVINSSVQELHSLILCHAQYTDSKRAWDVLACWDELLPIFVKVMPRDYKRVPLRLFVSVSGEQRWQNPQDF
jgi:glutamate synthase (ferredoxin)